MCLLRNRGKKCRHAKKAHSEKENLRDRCWGQGGGWEERSSCGARMQPLCVCGGEEEEEGGSGVPPAAVCRLGVHGGWAEWKAQPARREHLARHQLCTGHARRPASTAQTHKHWRSKQRQTNTRRTHWQHVGGGSGGRGAKTQQCSRVVCLLLVPRPAPPYLQTEVIGPLNYTAKDLLRFKVHTLQFIPIAPMLYRILN